MDFHQNQHQQWRHRPPSQPSLPPPQATTNTCPSCSFPHFPFCPPNPNNNPYFNNHQFHPPPPFSDGDRSFKRPRFHGDEDPNERRLRLIRDHGSSPPGLISDPNRHGHINNGNYYYQAQSFQRFYGGNGVSLPPLPSSPPPLPPPLPPPMPSLFPVGFGEASGQHYFHSKSFMNSSTGFANQDLVGVHGMLPKQHFGEERCFPAKQLSSSDKPTVVDASLLFKKPHRATRPDNFVIILRGLPGSGKSYLAKMLRDIEVENGGFAPRIHSMDDYFMTEVEKVEEGDISKSSVSVRGKKPAVKMVMEYCYEPEMEEAYRSSMLKAFKKTLEEGAFTFIIVDDRNLRKADFAQFWAVAKSSGYEVYILEASYKDPAGCAARNVHGFSLDDIQKMAEQWEEAPSFHLRLDAKSLCGGDDLKKSGIQEVDMDMEEEDTDAYPSKLGQISNVIVANHVEDDEPDDSSKDGETRKAEEENANKVNELGRSKWSNDSYEDETEQPEPSKGKNSALSGLMQAYGKKAKSVRWGDKGGNTGFFINAAKKANTLSLVIGPGAGYNLKANPLPEKSHFVPCKSNNAGEMNKQSVFQEQLQAERESFKEAFSKRQVRIGVDLDDESYTLGK